MCTFVLLLSFWAKWMPAVENKKIKMISGVFYGQAYLVMSVL